MIHWHSRAYFVSADAWREHPYKEGDTGVVLVDRGDGEMPSIDGLVTIYTKGIGEAAHIERAQTWIIRGIISCSSEPKISLRVSRATPTDIAAAFERQDAQNARGLNKTDRLLRDSVPDRWKFCTSPIGAVQSYIAELERALMRRGVDLDTLPTEEERA